MTKIIWNPVMIQFIASVALPHRIGSNYYMNPTSGFQEKPLGALGMKPTPMLLYSREVLN